MATMEYRKTSNMLIIFQLILYIAMISGYRGIAYYISICAVFLFVIGILATNKGGIPINRSWNCFMLFMVFYTATSLINFNVDNYIIYGTYYVLIFFPILIYEYLKTSSTIMIKNSLRCFMTVFVCFCFIAVGYYIANPGLAREMASWAIEEKLAIGGGYFLAYASAILCVYLFSKMINGRIEKKASYIFLCILFLCVVYLTQSSITILAMFGGMVVSLITKGRETSNNPVEELVKFLFIGILIIIAVSIIVYNKYAIANWILKMVAGKSDANIVFRRIEEIVNSFVYGKNTWHYDRRNETLTQSIEVFKQYPVFGIGYKYGYVYREGWRLGIGNHSEILDALARYGIVGGFLWLYPYARAIKQILRKNLGTAITVLLLMYFNPFLSFHSNAVLFLVIPLFEEILQRNEQGKIESIKDEVN